MRKIKCNLTSIKRMKNILYISLLLLFSVCSFGQSVGRALSNGNEDFEHKNYTTAEGAYRIANSKDPQKPTADYNLGNALYKQKLNSEAETAYLRSIKLATTKEEKHSAYHNLGNAYMKAKNYKAAEEAYKNALRNNPKDDETRYNYAVAKKMNQENPQQDQDNQDNKDDKDNKDNKDNKDQNKDNKDNKDQDKKDQDNKDDKGDKKDPNKENKDNKGDNKDDKDQKPQTPEQQKQQQTKEQMERMLDAVNRDEKQIQQRLIDKNKKGEKGKEEGAATTQRKKDW